MDYFVLHLLPAGTAPNARGFVNSTLIGQAQIDETER